MDCKQHSARAKHGQLARKKVAYTVCGGSMLRNAVKIKPEPKMHVRVRNRAAKEDLEHHNRKRPDVGRGAAVDRVEKLGRGPPDRDRDGVPDRVVGVVGLDGVPKVAYLDLALGADEAILGREVGVHPVAALEECHPGRNVAEHLGLGQQPELAALPGLQEVEQRAARRVLKDDEDGVLAGAW